MLSKVKNKIFPTIAVYAKKMRFQFMFYLMLVLIFPLSYLIVHIVGNAKQNMGVYAVGMFVSMLFSLFINMQAAFIANANQIAVIETYSVYKVEPLEEFMGEGIFHALFSLVLFVPTLVIIYAAGCKVIVPYMFPTLVISYIFLQEFSVLLGGLIANPNIANPIINLMYMIIVMITPLYAPAENISEKLIVFYAVNPFAHVCWMYQSAIGIVSPFPIYAIWIYLCALSVVMAIVNHRRWKNAAAIEKLTVI